MFCVWNCLSVSFHVAFIFHSCSLSCPLHVFPLLVFHFSLVVLGCPFIFRLSSCNFPIIFLISRPAFSWSEAIIPKSCSMFYVLSCALVDGVHVLVIFLSFAIHLVLSSFCFPVVCFHILLIFLSFEGPLSAEALNWGHNPQKLVPCFMFQVVFSWKGVQFPFISLYVAFIYCICPVMFLSFSFHVHLILVLCPCMFFSCFLSLPFHFPIMFFSFPSIFLPFQGPPFVEVKPQPPKPCSM